MNAALTQTAHVKRLLALSLAFWLTCGPALAGQTDISNVPLSAGSQSAMPNLLFTLDDSGSMAWDYLPDYVNDNNTCMTRSGGSVGSGAACSRGDPPYDAGGETGFNGVAYDPNLYYAPGVDSTGTPLLTPPLDPTSITNNAFVGGSNVNVTTNSTDKRFCNANNVCKRNGADSSGAVIGGGDGFGNTMATGQFPYRTNPSNASTVIFGLPEMMSIGSFARAGSTVTASTVEAHGLTTSDFVYVTTSSSGLNATCVAVASVPSTTSFTYASGSSGTISARNGSYRKCVPASFARSNSTVVVTTANPHGLVVNDIITVAVASNTAFNVTSATVTKIDSSTSFEYTTGTSSSIGATSGYWVRDGLYNSVSSVNGPPHSYWITPVEYCRDAYLTDCLEVLPGSSAPTGYVYPAYVRFCQTQAQALAPGGIGDMTGTPRCRGKYVNNVTGVPNYIYPRYGWFNRDTITSTVASYGNRPNRGDCAAAPVCSYTEEIQNYARWFAYYQTRMQMMKSAVGRAFLPFISNPPTKPTTIRVGFITINAANGGSVASSEYLKVNDFTTSQASTLYSKFYAIVPGNSTPLREALSRAGWIFAGKLGTGLTSGINTADDPMQMSCQRNYTLLTTDGYWNGNGGQTIDGTTMGNFDAVDNEIISPYTQYMVDRAITGTLDGVGATTSTSQSQTVLQQQLCSSNNTTTFGTDPYTGVSGETTCGCSAGQHRIKQRTITGNSVNGATPTSWTKTFQDITGCSLQYVTTTTTPVTRTEQAVCTGSGNASFAGGLVTQACGCPANYSAVYQAVSSLTNTVVTTDGTQTSNTTTAVSSSNTTITQTTACTADVTTTTTPTTEQEQVACIGSSTTAFSAGGNGGGGQTSCGCSAGQARLVTRSLGYNVVKVTTGGVLTSLTPGPNTSQGFSSTSCAAPATTSDTLTSATVVQSLNCTGNGNSVTFANGASQSCACGASASSGRHVLIRQTLTGANLNVDESSGGTVTNINSISGGAASYTYSINGSTWTSTAPTGSSCAGSSTTLTGSGPTVSGGTLTVGSYVMPTPTLSPNPTVTSGTATSSTARPTVALSPNPTTSNGTSTSSSTGTQLSISLSPNPTGIVLGTTTTVNNPGGTSNTLADVAMYYYQTDLRGGTDANGATTGPSTNPSGTDVSINNIAVKSGAKDFVYAQHMVTFAIGLADGLMHYQPDYDTATNGDFYNIKNGVVNGCFWTSGPCNWPAPVADGQSALDDLWHAAVNGRGQFYQALNANALDQGLQGALSSMGVKNAAAAASATSSPNVTQTSNSLFSTTFQTGTWAGRVFAQSIDPNSGNITDTHIWDASPLLLLQVSAASDTRTIYTFDSGSATKLKPFQWANLTGTEQTYFAGKCTAGLMAQCGGLTPAQIADADNGANMVGFLRGQTGLEATVYRDRIDDNLTTGGTDQTVLGDTMDAKPIYVGAPTFQYADSGYNAYVAAQATRTPLVYVGANDGYLHAFNAATGVEAYAYTPKFLMAGLYQLADTAYASKHVFYVDGTPTVGDVFDTGAGAWKTILVGGVNAGGYGFYALDVTDPANPKGLWEFCRDATVCSSTNDVDLGFSFGNPIIGKRASDGKWVVLVTSGLNNASGVGYFYVLDAITGSVLSKTPTTNPGSTLVGTPTTPSGLMKASAYFNSVLTDATFSFVYAGDQLGNVWRLDLTAATPVVTHMASLLDGAGRAQPITTRPELTQIGTSRVVFIGTGRYLGVSDLTDPGAASGIAWQQSLYAFKDKNNDYGNLRNDNKMVQQVLTNTNGTLSVSSNTVDWTTNDGWFLDFNPGNTAPGERVNVDPQLNLGTLTVATNIPTVSAANSCTTGGGTSHKYDFDFSTGSAITGQPLAINLSSIIVGMAIVQLPSGVIKDIVTTADTTKTSSTVAISAGSNSAQRFSYRER